MGTRIQSLATAAAIAIYVLGTASWCRADPFEDARTLAAKVQAQLNARRAQARSSDASALPGRSPGEQGPKERLTSEEQRVLMAFARGVLQHTRRGEISEDIGHNQWRTFAVYSRTDPDGQRTPERVILRQTWEYAPQETFSREFTLYPDGRIDPNVSSAATATGLATPSVRTPQNQEFLKEAIAFWMLRARRRQ